MKNHVDRKGYNRQSQQFSKTVAKRRKKSKIAKTSRKLNRGK